MSNDDAFMLVGNKSPIVAVQNMEDDTQIPLKISHSEVQSTSPPTAGVSKQSSGNKKRSRAGDHNVAMTDDYSSTNSNSLSGSLDKNGGHGSHQRHIMEDNGTCSDDYCDHLESSRCATKKQSTVVSEVNLFDSQTKLDSHGLLMCQREDRLESPEDHDSPDDLLLRQVHDGSNYSLRVKRKKNNFQGDRFIPLRSGELESQR